MALAPNTGGVAAYHYPPILLPRRVAYRFPTDLMAPSARSTHSHSDLSEGGRNSLQLHLRGNANTFEVQELQTYFVLSILYGVAHAII